MIHGSERAPLRFLPILCWAVQVMWEVASSYFDQSAVVDEVCCEDSSGGTTTPWRGGLAGLPRHWWHSQEGVSLGEWARGFTGPPL